MYGKPTYRLRGQDDERTKDGKAEANGGDPGDLLKVRLRVEDVIASPFSALLTMSEADQEPPIQTQGSETMICQGENDQNDGRGEYHSSKIVIPRPSPFLEVI